MQRPRNTRGFSRDFPRRARGFTLIELMIVIAILLVLMVALIPAVEMFQIRAARFACQSNLGQHLYQAALSFATEPGLNGNMPQGDGQYVMESFLMYGFIENPSQIVCPSSKHTPTGISRYGDVVDPRGIPDEDNVWGAHWEVKASITGGELGDKQYSYTWTTVTRKNGEGAAMSADRVAWHDKRFNILYSNGRVESTRKTHRIQGWSDLQ